MRTTLDFSPLFRAGIGFDRVFDVLESASRVQAPDPWPPYDILRTGEDSYRIVMAVAGFDRDELTLTDQPNLLVVAGSKKNAGAQDSVYLHRGIADRQFERRFELADHVKVANATLQNGLLTIELQREVPEALKPRRIAIHAERHGDTAAGTPMATATAQRQIEAPRAA
ncbi:MAG TPA: Hsp20 family protein [Dokdonella sp.]|nr:Hsp20 family protein [Dokdonella sp.]